MYLGRLLAGEALPSGDVGQCGHPALWRCLTCLGKPLYCTECCRNAHSANVLHRLEIWTGSFFRPCTLRHVGVEVHCGHSGQPCPVKDDPPQEKPTATQPAFPTNVANGGKDDGDPEGGFWIDDDDSEWGGDDDGLLAGVDPEEKGAVPISALPVLKAALPPPPPPPSPNSRILVVVDVSGIHELCFSFCSCPGAMAEDVQLLDMGFYPASDTRPSTVFTEAVLDDFLLANKICKTSPRNYFTKLRRGTNNAFPHLVPVCFAPHCW